MEEPFKRLLSPCRIGGNDFFRSDWMLNLYRGCNHGCIYCDSRSVCYRMKDFDRVRVKKDALAALETELRAKRKAGVVSMGAASDAYNALEEQRLVTRGALILLRRYGFGVSLSTKSALVSRDADVLGDLARHGHACVAFSVTTADSSLAARLEPGASSPKERFAAMRALHDAGVRTGTWMNPMLPYITDTKENLLDVLRKTADAGGSFAICHFGVTLREGDREYFYRALERDACFAGVREKYVETFGLRYLCASPDAEALSTLFCAESERLGLAHDFQTLNQLISAAEPEQTRLF